MNPRLPLRGGWLISSVRSGQTGGALLMVDLSTLSTYAAVARCQIEFIDWGQLDLLSTKAFHEKAGRSQVGRLFFRWAKFFSCPAFANSILHQCSVCPFQETRGQHRGKTPSPDHHRPRGLLLASSYLCFWGKGRRDIVLDGTLQWCFEESAFFPNGDCSNKPLWWEWPNNRDSDLDAKWKTLGKPTALRVKLRGNLSSIGLHGHLGAYHREVQPITLLSVSAASRCQWTWVEETR
jgi:hypothetical protein